MLCLEANSAGITETVADLGQWVVDDGELL